MPKRTKKSRAKTAPPKKKSRRTRTPKPNLPPPHIGRPMKGCRCPQCTTHRLLDWQAARDAHLAAAAEKLGGFLAVVLYPSAAPDLAGALFGTIIQRN